MRAGTTHSITSAGAWTIGAWTSECLAVTWLDCPIHLAENPLLNRAGMKHRTWQWRAQDQDRVWTPDWLATESSVTSAQTTGTFGWTSDKNPWFPVQMFLKPIQCKLLPALFEKLGWNKDRNKYLMFHLSILVIQCYKRTKIYKLNPDRYAQGSAVHLDLRPGSLNWVFFDTLLGQSLTIMGFLAFHSFLAFLSHGFVWTWVTPNFSGDNDNALCNLKVSWLSHSIKIFFPMILYCWWFKPDMLMFESPFFMINPDKSGWFFHDNDSLTWNKACY